MMEHLCNLPPFLQIILVVTAFGAALGAGATGKLTGLGKLFGHGKNSQEQQVNVEIGGKVGAANGSCVDCLQNLATLFPCKSHGELVAKVAFAETQDAGLKEWIGKVEGKIDGLHDTLTAMMMAMVEKGFKIQIPKKG